MFSTELFKTLIATELQLCFQVLQLLLTVINTNIYFIIFVNIFNIRQT